MKIGTLLLRTTLGGAFAGHGAQKLLGAQGGAGLKGTAQHFEQNLGLRPGIAHAALAGVAEAGGGLGLLLGYHTPLAAAGVIGSMTTAIQRVHGKNGWNIQDGGFEYNALIIAAALSVAETGPGFLSLDALRGKNRHGLIWMGFSLAAGVGGALAVNALAGPDAPTTADVAAAASDAVESAGQTVAGAVQSAGESLAEAAGQAGDQLASTAQDAGDAIQEAGETAGDAVQDAAQNGGGATDPAGASDPVTETEAPSGGATL